MRKIGGFTNLIVMAKVQHLSGIAKIFALSEYDFFRFSFEKNNNMFGTMTGMAANRRGQISRRGGSAY